MALPFGKLTLIVGAGLIGSVLAKEGRLPSVSDCVSGAFKLVLQQLSHDESSPSKPKAQNDSLRQQVNNLREELQLLVSNRPITIVTTRGSATGRYGIIVVVIVVGYGYIWWKGWKLSDMMFATRRTLSEACDSVSRRLEDVYSAVAAAKEHLSSRIDGMDSKIMESADNASATEEEISKLRGDLTSMGDNVKSVNDVVRSLETKISQIEGKQGLTVCGLGRLVTFVSDLETRRTFDPIEGSSRGTSVPALELPQGTPARALSLPPNSLTEPPSPSTLRGATKRPLQEATGDSGLKFHGVSNGAEVSSPSSFRIPYEARASEIRQQETSGSGLFGLNSSGSGVNMVRRSLSAKLSFNI